MAEAASLRLASATRSAHQSLEGQPRLARLFADDYRLDELSELLACMLSIYRPLERQLLSGEPARLLDYRPRLPMLEQAGACLPAQILEEAVLSPLPDAAMQWGALYVVEGSALGGQLIHRRLTAQFPNLPAEALAFWHPHGEDVGSRWRLFRSLADQELAGDEPCRLAVDAAIAVFDAFRRALA